MPSFTSIFNGLRPRYIWKLGENGREAAYQGSEDDECTEEWVSLFLDLIYVCVFSVLSRILNTCEATEDVVVYIASVVGMFFMSRMTINEYANRFYQNDLFHRLFFLLYVVGIAIMTMNANLALDVVDDEGASTSTCTINPTYFSGFSYGHTITRLSLVALYFGAGIFDKSGQVLEQFGVRCLILMISTVVYLVGASVIHDSSDKIILTACVAAVEFSYFFIFHSVSRLNASGYITTKIISFHFPINIFEAQDRNGGFFLIALGESVISLLLPEWGSADINDVYLVNMFGLVLIFSFAIQFFDKAQRGKNELHAGRRDALAGLLFLLAHAVLGFFMLLCTAGILGVADSIRNDNEPMSSANNLYLCVGSGLTSFMILFMRVLHRGLAYRLEQFQRMAHLFVRIALSTAHLVLLAVEIEPAYALVVHALIAASSVLFDVVCDLINASNSGGQLCLTLSHASQQQLEKQATKSSSVDRGEKSHLTEALVSADDSELGRIDANE